MAIGFWRYSLVDTVTLWAATPGGDGYGGGSFAAPAIVAGRWFDSYASIYDAAGVELQSTVQVVLDQDVSEGDYLYLGDGTSSADPQSVDGALPVRQFKKARDILSGAYYRKAYL